MRGFFKDKNPNKESFSDFWSFSKKNYILFLIGIILILSGYIIMAFGEVYSFQSLTIAPIMLFFGYIILIPIALLYKGKK
tara:strand:- start:40 stop:279 length:240 start_codon:yes stop_codon:yes gene_type:complete